MKKLYILLAATICMMAAGCNRQSEKMTDMKYRPLGNTGLMVSEISIGCGGFEKMDSASALELMTVALDSGMNYIDIYDANPKTRSNIGYALQGRRDKMIIQGHIGTIYKDGQHSRTRDIDETRQGFEDLLSRLGTDYIEVGMIHIADSPEEWQGLQNSPFLDYALSLIVPSVETISFATFSTNEEVVEVVSSTLSMIFVSTLSRLTVLLLEFTIFCFYVP